MWYFTFSHYSDVILGAMVSQITSVSIDYSTICSGPEQRKHQSLASLDFVRGIQRSLVNSPHKGPVTRKDVSIWWRHHDKTLCFQDERQQLLTTKVWMRLVGIFGMLWIPIRFFAKMSCDFHVFVRRMWSFQSILNCIDRVVRASKQCCNTVQSHQQRFLSIFPILQSTFLKSYLCVISIYFVQVVARCQPYVEPVQLQQCFKCTHCGGENMAARYHLVRWVSIRTKAPWWRHQMETFSALLVLYEGIHRSSVNSPHKGQWRGALTFSLICTWTNDWVNNRNSGDLRRHRPHYDVTVITTAK